MEQNDNDLVDEATGVRRQLTDACAAVEHANTEGISLGARKRFGVQRSDNGCRAGMRINERERGRSPTDNNAEKEPSREGCNR